MVVQHNMQAMNANRMLNITTGSQAKSTEKLSSGYRINRAADDAAGLTISEKMRKQMRGLDRASTNAEDGVSAVQTAEGALTEVHSMLQRMNELANQAANGSNSKSDRDAIQAEIEQLTTEIDRVAETTKFNETYLLKGDADGTKKTEYVNAHDAGIAGKLSESVNGKTTFKLESALKEGDKITVAGEELTIGNSKNVDDYDTLANVGATAVQIGDKITKADGTELNITSKATISDVESFLSTKIKAGGAVALGTLQLADGTTYEISGTTSGGKGSITKTTTTGIKNTADTANTDIDNTNPAKSTINYILNETVDLKGATFTDTDGNVFELETSLNRDELTTFDKTNGKQDATMTATSVAGLNTKTINVGDTVTTVDTDTATGNKTETSKTAYGTVAAATDGAVINTNDLADKLNKLAAGSKIRVGSYDATDLTTAGNYVEYTIAGSKDAENGNTLTVDSILGKLKEGDLVGLDSDNDASNGFDYLDTSTYSVAGVDSEEGTVSVKDAYKKIAKELEAASSIGTDEGKEATVTSNGDGSFTINQGTVEVAESLNFGLHVGADADMTNKINVNIDSMSAAGLGIKGINVSDNTGSAATYAIDAISDAIAKVSEQRSALGAVQNRLEHTIANLDNVVENTTSAESRIRDTDMASEMVEFSKNNILAQAGQSMLAQANQSNQGVLSLLG